MRRRCSVYASCDWPAHRSEPGLDVARYNWLDASSPPSKPEWDHDDRDLLLKSANRPRYIETGVSIRAFVEDAKNILEMSGRSSDRWTRFIVSWLGSNEAEKVRRSQFVADNVDYNTFREGLYTLFGCFDFEDSYSQQLRVFGQSGAEPLAAFASRTTDLSTRAYPSFPTDLQLDLAVDRFISGLRDVSSTDYLRRERARRRITWQEAVQMAQAAEVSRAAEYTHPLEAAAIDAMCTKSTNLAHAATTIAADCAMSAQVHPGNTGNSHVRECFETSRDAYEDAFVVLLRRVTNQFSRRTEDPLGLSPLQRRRSSCTPRTLHPKIIV